MAFEHDIAVVGLGRLGLPLALYFASKGRQVIGIDKDEAVIETVRSGSMPFHEDGAQNLLISVLEKQLLTFETDMASISDCSDIVITVGTPLLSPLEPDLAQIRAALDAMLPHLCEGQHLALGSTIGPGTTKYLAGYIEQRTSLRIGRTLFLTHCPERIAEGHFFKEIESFPQIVGALDKASASRATELFKSQSSKLLVTTAIQAELAKVWSNMLRYTLFVLPNLLLMNCERYGANVFEVIELINRDYPRGGILQPGLTAGPCLGKDFSFIEEQPLSANFFLDVWKIHETLPLFLIETAKKYIGSLQGCKVAVLGLSYKAESDDTRNSLSVKLIRYLERELAEVDVHDPYVQNPPRPLERVLEDAKLIIVAINHQVYGGYDFLSALHRSADPNALLIDIWNVTQGNVVFRFIEDLRNSREEQGELS